MKYSTSKVRTANLTSSIKQAQAKAALAHRVRVTKITPQEFPDKLRHVGLPSPLENKKIPKYVSPHGTGSAEQIAIEAGYCHGQSGYQAQVSGNKTILQDVNRQLALLGFAPIQMPQVVSVTGTWGKNAEDKVRKIYSDRAWNRDRCKKRLWRRDQERCKNDRTSKYYNNFLKNMNKECYKIGLLEQSVLEDFAVDAENLHDSKINDEIRQEVNSKINDESSQSAEIIEPNSHSTKIIAGILLIALLGFLVYQFLIKK